MSAGSRLGAEVGSEAISVPTARRLSTYVAEPTLMPVKRSFSPLTIDLIHIGRLCGDHLTDQV
jgi:hypothetical protein